MQNNVPKPDLNKGSLYQESFGNHRGDNFKFPKTLSKAQGPSVPIGEPTKVIDVPTIGPSENWSWEQGTFHFARLEASFLTDMMCLSMTRLVMAQQGTEACLRKKATLGNEDVYNQHNIKRPRSRDLSFLGEMDTIRQYLMPAGIQFSDKAPESQMGTLDVSKSYITGGSNTKVLPVCVNGPVLSPRFWNGELLQNQWCNIIIKMVPCKGKYYNNDGRALSMNSEMTQTDLIPDIIFHTNQANDLPHYISDMSVLYERKMGQPDILDYGYIEWTPDTRTKSKEEVVGTPKPGMIFRIGKCKDGETTLVTDSTSSRIGMKNGTQPQWQEHYNHMKKFKMFLDIKPVWTSA